MTFPEAQAKLLVPLLQTVWLVDLVRKSEEIEVKVVMDRGVLEPRGFEIVAHRRDRSSINVFWRFLSGVVPMKSRMTKNRRERWVVLQAD